MTDFSALKEKLANEKWPEMYMYKFIMPADNQKIAQVEALFDSMADVVIRNSSKGNYVSITAKEMAVNENAVIKKYEAAAKIEGVMVL